MNKKGHVLLPIITASFNKSLEIGTFPTMLTIVNDVIVKILELLCVALENDEYPFGLFIDLRKSFGTVDHNILHLNVEHYGIRGHTLAHLKYYLSSRHQYVSINGITSFTQPVDTRVPQGSVLGPLLLIYISDLPTVSRLLEPVLLLKSDFT